MPVPKGAKLVAIKNKRGNIFGARLYIYFTVAHFAANNDLIPNVIS